MDRDLGTLASQLIAKGASVGHTGKLRCPPSMKAETRRLSAEDRARLTSTVEALLALNESEAKDQSDEDAFIAALVASTERENEYRRKRTRLLHLASLSPGELRSRVLAGSVSADEIKQLRRL